MASPPKTREKRSPTPDDEDQDATPLHHKRVFGAGLHRKKIAFVPASHRNLESLEGSSGTAKEASQSVADLYLSLVLPGETALAQTGETDICEICKLPFRPDSENHGEGGKGPYPKSAHQTSLAHQICVPHSHPPSALDRSRMGLTVLESHGWNPDSRKGLGAGQQGIQFPIKPKPKDNMVGIGIEVPKTLPPKERKPQLLDAGRVRKQYKEEKERAARLHRQLFGDDRLERYLGAKASDT